MHPAVLRVFLDRSLCGSRGGPDVRRDERKPTDMTTFAALGVDGDLVAALDERGITAPFPIQALTIADALAGRDVCGKAKTGSGKTLAFGLPMLQTVEQGRAAPAPGPRAGAHPRAGHPGGRRARPARRGPRRAASSPSTAAPTSRSRSKALAKGAEIVVATPGRLIDLLDRKAVELVRHRAPS